MKKLPDLVSNAYFLLGQDWIETKKLWDKQGSNIPPVMINCMQQDSDSSQSHVFI